MAKYRKKWKRQADLEARQKYQQFRAEFYYEVKKAKSKCWNNFLENATDRKIFKAFQYIRQNKVEKLSIF